MSMVLTRPSAQRLGSTDWSTVHRTVRWVGSRAGRGTLRAPRRNVLRRIPVWLLKLMGVTCADQEQHGVRDAPTEHISNERARRGGVRTAISPQHPPHSRA